MKSFNNHWSSAFFCRSFFWPRTLAGWQIMRWSFPVLMPPTSWGPDDDEEEIMSFYKKKW